MQERQEHRLVTYSQGRCFKDLMAGRDLAATRPKQMLVHSGGTPSRREARPARRCSAAPGSLARSPGGPQLRPRREMRQGPTARSDVLQLGLDSVSVSLCLDRSCFDGRSEGVPIKPRPFIRSPVLRRA